MIKVGVTVSESVGDRGDFLANVHALESAGADMIDVAGSSPESWVLLGAIAAVTERVRLRTAGPAPENLISLCRGRLVVGDAAGETWTEEPMPADRDAWATMLRDREAAGVTGVVVAWDPRLIDLLRNPDADDRSDLLMSTG